MRCRRWLAAGALATGTLVASSILCPALADTSGASSTTSGSGSGSGPGSAVIVTPLLEMMVFGDTVGLPLGCNLGASVLSNASTALSSTLGQTVETCGTISSEGYTMLEQGITESSSLSALNTLLNPLIAAGATQLQNTGTNDAALLGILAPTVSSSSGTLAFFEGSS